MGFFSDLKEDLSQAVNELMPDDEMIQRGTSVQYSNSVVGETVPERIEEEVPQMPIEEVAEVFESYTEEIPEVMTTDSIEMLETYEMPSEEAPEVDEEPSEEAPEVDEEPLEEASEVYEEPLEEVSEVYEEPLEEVSEVYGIPAEEIAEPQISDNSEENPLMDELMASFGEEQKETPETERPVVLQTKDRENENMIENRKENKGEKTAMENEVAFISSAMTVTGDVSVDGELHVAGTVNGNVTVTGKLYVTGQIVGDVIATVVYTDGAKCKGEIHGEEEVQIGKDSVIKGNISSATASVAGAVKGDIDVNGAVVLDGSAIVVGNIKSKSVQINNGAVIEGMCSQCYAEVSPVTFFDE